MNEITRTPLCWPNGVPRTAPYRRGSPGFGSRTLAAAASFVKEEINRLNNRPYDYDDQSVIVSSNLRLKSDGMPHGNQPQPSDSGIAVYFTLRINRGGKFLERPIVMSCDKWRLVEDNLYAIGKDIYAQRARQRWGCTNYEQSFRGYVAIPEKCGGAAWWDVLGVKSTDTKDVVIDKFRSLAKVHHPDKNGDIENWNRLQDAYDQALASF